jgi:hypothetical protein
MATWHVAKQKMKILIPPLFENSCGYFLAITVLFLGTIVSFSAKNSNYT